MKATEHLAPEIGPEFRRQIYKSVIGHAGSKVDKHGASGPARCGIIQVRKTGAHRATERVVPIEGGASGGLPDDHGTADRVAKAIQETVLFSAANIARILMQCRGHHEIAKEILRRDVGC